MGRQNEESDTRDECRFLVFFVFSFIIITDGNLIQKDASRVKYNRRQTQKERRRDRNKQSGRQTDKQTCIRTDRQINRITNRQTKTRKETDSKQLKLVSEKEKDR